MNLKVWKSRKTNKEKLKSSEKKVNKNRFKWT